MIDVENQIFTIIKTAIVAVNSACTVTSTLNTKTATFPYALAVQMDSYPSRQTNSLNEEYAVLTWQIDIYSNDTARRKTICSTIAEAVDNALSQLNFRRMSRVPVQDPNDPGIYRLTLRYTVETDGTTFYRR